MAKDFTPADLKAILAQHGQTMRPDAEITYLDVPERGTAANVLVLERVVEGVTPDYCTHGYATCTGCQHPCWIGHATAQVLTRREAVPLCIPCATTMIPPESRQPVKRVLDHRREDGPHG